MVWIQLAKDKGWLRACMNTAVSLRLP